MKEVFKNRFNCFELIYIGVIVHLLASGTISIVAAIVGVIVGSALSTIFREAFSFPFE